MGAKGQPKTGGRKKGSINKTTEKAREIFLSTMSGQQDRIKEALNELYKDDKQKYLEVLSRYFPYFIPKQEKLDISLDTTDLPFSIAIENREKTNTE